MQNKYNVVFKGFLNSKSQVKIFDSFRKVPQSKESAKLKAKKRLLAKIRKQKTVPQSPQSQYIADLEVYNAKMEYIHRILTDSYFADKETNKKLNLYADEKSLRTAMSRAKNKVFDYARSNTWDYFITLTGNKDYLNRYDYDSMLNYVQNWLHNVRRDYAADLKYIVVPELHKGKDSECKCSRCGHLYKNFLDFCPLCSEEEKIFAWHFHGLLGNIDSLPLEQAYNKDNSIMCRPYIDRDKEGKIIAEGVNYIKTLPSYTFGYTTATEIRDMDRVSKYIAKYITEDVCALSKGRKRYLISRNLELPEFKYVNLTEEELEDLKFKMQPFTVYEKPLKVEICGYVEEISLFELDKFNYGMLDDILASKKEKELMNLYSASIAITSSLSGVESSFGGVVETTYTPMNPLKNYKPIPLSNEKISESVKIKTPITFEGSIIGYVYETQKNAVSESYTLTPSPYFSDFDFDQAEKNLIQLQMLSTKNNK